MSRTKGFWLLPQYHTNVHVKVGRFLYARIAKAHASYKTKGQTASSLSLTDTNRFGEWSSVNVSRRTLTQVLKTQVLSRVLGAQVSQSFLSSEGSCA